MGKLFKGGHYLREDINQRNTVDCSKGQLNLEWIYEVIVSPKMPTKILRISALEV